MKPFRLQPILKLRQYAEDLRKRELAKALAEEQRRKDVVLRLADSRQQQAEKLRDRHLETDIDVRGLIEHRQYIGLLEREIHLHLRGVATAEHETRLRRAATVEAMRDRKALDVLRERFEARGLRQAERVETAEMDEVASGMVHAPARTTSGGGRS